MVILKLKGGLGNQLFQYAAAKQIATNNNVELIVDAISGFKSDPFDREYLLNVFSISAKTIGDSYAKKIYNTNRYYRRLYIFIQNILPSKYRFYLKEPEELNFDLHIKNISLNKNVYLEGYFQSHLYFESISEIIKRELVFIGELNNKVKQILDEINMCESVSIHVRSFNIGKKNDTSFINGNCSLEFYENAIKYILNNFKRPVFFVFSDDLEWAKKMLNFSNFKINLKYILYHDNLDHSIDDFVLMSSCKSNIISNSTFSWWAAWLNKNSNKTVISPLNWCVSKKVSTRDIYPQEWVVI